MMLFHPQKKIKFVINEKYFIVTLTVSKVTILLTPSKNTKHSINEKMSYNNIESFKVTQSLSNNKNISQLRTKIC